MELQIQFFLLMKIKVEELHKNLMFLFPGLILFKKKKGNLFIFLHKMKVQMEALQLQFIEMDMCLRLLRVKVLM